MQMYTLARITQMTPLTEGNKYYINKKPLYIKNNEVLVLKNTTKLIILSLFSNYCYNYGLHAM